MNLVPMFLFIVVPCLVKNVGGCWKMTANTSNMVHIGSSLSTTLMFSIGNTGDLVDLDIEDVSSSNCFKFVIDLHSGFSCISNSVS